MAKVNIEERHKMAILHHQGLSEGEMLQKIGVFRCAVQALLHTKQTGKTVDHRNRMQHSRNLSSLQYFSSTSKDTQTQYQLRAGRNQWDAGTPIYSLEKSFQKWSSLKSCDQKAISLKLKKKDKHLTFAQEYKDQGTENSNR